MPFSNVPTTQPLTYGLDYYNWPCISGESFPPTFTASPAGSVCSYTSKLGWPSVRVNQAANTATGTTKSVWPILPIYAPRTSTFNGFTLTAQVALTVSTAGHGIEITVGSSFAGIHVDKFNNTPNFGIWAIYNGGTQGATNSAIAYDTNWHSISLTVTATGLLTVTFDTTTILAATAINYPPGTIDIAQITAAGYNAASNGNSDSHISNLKIVYT